MNPSATWESMAHAIGEAAAAKVLAKLPALLRAEVRQALAEQGEGLKPLAQILGCSPAAARMRLGRDAELAALGVRIGRRLWFRPSEVLALLASRGGGKPRLRRGREEQL